MGISRLKRHIPVIQWYSWCIHHSLQRKYLVRRFHVVSCFDIRISCLTNDGTVFVWLEVLGDEDRRWGSKLSLKKSMFVFYMKCSFFLAVVCIVTRLLVLSLGINSYPSTSSVNVLRGNMESWPFHQPSCHADTLQHSHGGSIRPASPVLAWSTWAQQWDAWQPTLQVLHTVLLV